MLTGCRKTFSPCRRLGNVKPSLRFQWQARVQSHQSSLRELNSLSILAEHGWPQNNATRKSSTPTDDGFPTAAWRGLLPLVIPSLCTLGPLEIPGPVQLGSHLHITGWEKWMDTQVRVPTPPSVRDPQQSNPVVMLFCKRTDCSRNWRVLAWRMVPFNTWDGYFEEYSPFY